MNSPLTLWSALLLFAISPLSAQINHASIRHGDTVSHRGAPPERADKFEGTRKMIALLEEANSHNYRFENPFATTPRVKLFAELSKTSTDNLVWKWTELINAGRQDEAIPELIAARERSDTTGPPSPVEKLLALAYLRQGEQDNCITNHTAQACLFPIESGGFHTNQRGSRAAINILLSILRRDPSDAQSMWLLNIAYMTIDEYPQGVPEHCLLAPELFASDYPLPRFNNIALDLGVDHNGLAGGSCTEDFDLDGDIDIMTTSWGMHDGMHYYRNNGDGTFTDATDEAGLTGLTGGLNMIQADYDNDGYPDVLILRGAWMAEYGRYPNSLLHNNGDGTFSDVTVAAGLLSYHPTQAAVFSDLNNDGLLDIFIGNESQRQPHPCELYVNNGDGTFTERAHEVGLDVTAFVKGVSCGDFNNDGLPDLFLSCQMQTNRLFMNNGIDRRGRWTFTNASERANIGAPVASFPTLVFDYNNDGWDDIYVCGYGVRVFSSASTGMTATVVNDYLGKSSGGERPRLYRNNRNGTFTDVGTECGLDDVIFGMGCNFGDLDNDGYLDIYVGTGAPDLAGLMPNRMYRNNGGKSFQDVTTAGGFGHLQKGHAISFGDLDNDGDQDIYTIMGGAFEGDLAHAVLFENPGSRNHWITLSLKGVRTNRSAIGARIRVTVATPRGDRAIYVTVNSGGSFGASTLQQEIGLGDATAIRSIAVTWPRTREKQLFKDVAMDHFYNIAEGGHHIAQVDRAAIHFKTGGAPLNDPHEDHDHHHHHD